MFGEEKGSAKKESVTQLSVDINKKQEILDILISGDP